MQTTRIFKKQQHKNDTKYYMYGKHAVFAAIKNPNRTIHKVYCFKKIFEEHKNILNNVNIEIVDNEFMIRKIGKDYLHQGIIAYVDTVYLKDLKHIDSWPNKDRIVILDQVTDPQNIGAIIRSAAAFGIKKLILPTDNAPNENAVIAKAASGCLELIQIIKVINLKAAIQKLKNKGFWIAGLDIKGKDVINDIATIEKLAIIIGSEGKGMRRFTTDSCDFLVKIDISTNVESLNASNAASIIFYRVKNLTIY